MHANLFKELNIALKYAHIEFSHSHSLSDSIAYTQWQNTIKVKTKLLNFIFLIERCFK